MIRISAGNGNVQSWTRDVMKLKLAEVVSQYPLSPLTFQHPMTMIFMLILHLSLTVAFVVRENTAHQ